MSATHDTDSTGKFNMGAFQLAIDIRRRPADVFAFVAEPQNMPLWYEAVRQVTKTTANPTAVGSTYDIVRSLPNGPAYNNVEVVEYTLNHQVTIESRSGPTPFRYSYRVEPNQEDTTTLTLDANITSAGLPGPAGLVGGIATQLFKHGMKQNLHQLKQILEAANHDAA
jgi:uncharacterized protein YndB with AHSA1/START domain